MAGGGGGPGIGSRLRRGVLDAAAVLCGLLGWAVLLGARLESGALPEPQWLFRADALAGLLGCLLLLLRRRHPVHLAVVLLALSVFSETVAAAMLVAVFAVALDRPPRTTALVFGLSLASAAVYVVLRPEPDSPRAAVFVGGALIQAGAVGACGCAAGASSCSHCTSVPSAPRPTPPCAPSAPSTRRATRSLARCTTSWATGCRCSACTRERWSTARTLRPPT